MQTWLIAQIILTKISIGNYTFFISSLGAFTGSLYGIEYNLANLFDEAQYVKDYMEILDLPDFIEKPKNGGTRTKKEAPSIEFRNVSFRYPNTEVDVLKNLSFTINPGEKVSIVGENGAGKTTLIKLLARFYDVTEGEILINGINIKEINLESYYKIWGVLFQSFAKYWFTVNENIGIGNPQNIFNNELIKESATKAGADTFIKKLKNGYENMLSTDFENGIDLSGGQWQKIGIARGFFAQPKMIILDEPTSALDALAEAKIFEEIEKSVKDTTMIIISHRFATVRNTDKIIVIENGKIEEEGKHNDLMQNEQGLYYKMFTSKAKGYK